MVDVELQPREFGAALFQPRLGTCDRGLTLVEQRQRQCQGRSGQAPAVGFALALGTDLQVTQQAPAPCEGQRTAGPSTSERIAFA